MVEFLDSGFDEDPGLRQDSQDIFQDDDQLIDSGGGGGTSVPQPTPNQEVVVRARTNGASANIRIRSESTIFRDERVASSTAFASVTLNAPQNVVVSIDVPQGQRFLRWQRLVNGQSVSFRDEESMTFAADDDHDLVAVLEEIPVEVPDPVTPPPTEIPQGPQPPFIVRARVEGGNGQLSLRPQSSAFPTPQRGQDVSVSITTPGLNVAVSIVPFIGFRFIRWERIVNGERINLGARTNLNYPVRDDYDLIAVMGPDRVAGTPTPVDQTPTPVPPPVTPEPPVPPPTPVPPTPVATRPTPTPVPVTWRNCIDGRLYEGNPPQGYRLATFRGAVGGQCWEPATQIGFNPTPSQANFVYQRGSSEFPRPFTFAVENPSFGTSYRVRFNTNTTYFRVTPSDIRIEPQSRRQITIEVRRERIEDLGDGLTDFNLVVDVEET